MLREVLVSCYFGASAISDIFIIAIRFPNFFRRFLAEGGLQPGLVPELSRRDDRDAILITQNIFSIMFYFLVVLVSLMELGMPGIISFMLPGYSGVHFDMALKALYITTPYLMFISLTAVLTSFLNSRKQFAIESSSQMILNFTLIGGLFWFKGSSIHALTVFYLLGGLLQFAWCFIFCPSCFSIKRPVFDPVTKGIFKRMFQGATASGILQINTFIDQCLASFLTPGSITYLFNADRLNQLPLSIIGVSLASVMMPSFARFDGDQEKLDNALQKSLLLSLELSIFAAILIYLFSDIGIYLVYCRGEFTMAHVLQTASATKAYAFGIPAYVACKVFSSYFFAQKNMRIALYIAILTLVTNTVGNLILMQYFAHVGLAIATSLAGWASFLLYISLVKKSLSSQAFLAQCRRLGTWCGFSICILTLVSQYGLEGMLAPLCSVFIIGLAYIRICGLRLAALLSVK